MIAWIGVIVALAFFVLWGGGVLQELGRRLSAGQAPPLPRRPDDPAPAAPLPEDRRLQVFENFIRSLPDEDDDGSGPAAA